MDLADLYPPGWPKCPGCDLPALDGHVTCGRTCCPEGTYRRLRDLERLNREQLDRQQPPPR